MAPACRLKHRAIQRCAPWPCRRAHRCSSRVSARWIALASIQRIVEASPSRRWWGGHRAARGAMDRWPGGSDRRVAPQGLAPGRSRAYTGAAMSEDKKVDSFAALFEASAPTEGQARAVRLHTGDRVKAEVVRVGKDAVFVELVDPPPIAKRVQAYFELPDLADATGAA